MSGTLHIPSEYYNCQYICYDINEFIDKYKNETKTHLYKLQLWNLPLGEIKIRYIHPNQKFYVHTNGTAQFNGDKNHIIVIEDYIIKEGRLTVIDKPMINIRDIGQLNDFYFMKRIDLQNQFDNLNNSTKERKLYREEGKRFMKEFNEYLNTINIEALEIILKSYENEFSIVEIEGKNINVFYDNRWSGIFSKINLISQTLFKKEIKGSYPIHDYINDINGWDIDNYGKDFTKNLIIKNINHRIIN